MIWGIVRIWEVVDQFLQKTILIFLKNFLDLMSDLLEKRVLLIINHYGIKSEYN